MVNLASLLEQGYTSAGVDRQGAFDLYEKAADKGNRIAREKVCVAYLLGEGRPLNVSKGMGYCNTLSEDSPAALFAGGFDYDNGVSGPRDDGKALTLYSKAGHVGSGEAMDAIGRKALALNRPDLARKWFRQGVFLGAADAMDHLAVMAEGGQGGPVDKAEAYWLYVNAARRGNVHAKAWVDALPAKTEPLDRSSIISRADGVEEGAITVTTQEKDGPHSQAYTLSRMISLFTGFYPAAARDDAVGGDVLVHCYVNADHVVDVCIVEYEYPIGYSFGGFAQTFFDEHLSVAAVDTGGKPTANTVFILGFNWKLN